MKCHQCENEIPQEALFCLFCGARTNQSCNVHNEITPLDLSRLEFRGYGLLSATRKCLLNYASFEGRATRSEYWIWEIFTGFILASAYIIDFIYFGDISLLSFGLCLLLVMPTYSVSVRRMHDLGYTGWVVLTNFVPCVGLIIFLVLSCLDSQKGSNEYGPSEKYPD